MKIKSYIDVWNGIKNSDNCDYEKKYMKNKFNSVDDDLPLNKSSKLI